ncbi:hypothetical protein [Conyzicola sp.]|uniref:hypothetical protein n=1 Tax=Conyzicola sp. TaxID=1969404 RepID=UPI003988F6FB
MNVREVSGRRPLLVVGLVSGGLFGVLMSLFTALTSPERNIGFVVILGAVGGLLFGTAFAFIVARQNRGMGGASTARAVQAAISARALPPAIDESWLSALRYRKRQATRYRWLNPLIFLFLTLLGVISLANSFVPDWLAWIEVIGFPVIAVIGVVQTSRELAAIAELERQLTQRD